MKKLIIDTDTASDDAVALIMAAKSKEVQIEALTLVSGNVHVEQAVQNAAYVLKLCHSSLPIYTGASKPLIRSLKTAEHVHGKDGMGDIGLPLHGFVQSRTHAVDIIINKIEASPKEITLVCLAPLTNIAMALSKAPSIAKKVKECVIMGGVGKGRGNITPLSEYNFWADPEAANIVFNSDIPIKMVGWDISRKYAVFDDRDIQEIRQIRTPLSKFVIDIQKTLMEYAKGTSQLKGFDLPDPIAMAIVIDPSIVIKSKRAFVSILLNDDHSRGQASIDYVSSTGNKPNAEVVLKVNRKKFVDMLHQSLDIA